jgi:hypothetical protein
VKIERLREVLAYDPLTGDLRWIQTLSNRATAGSIAGAPRTGARYGSVMVDGESLLTHRVAWALHYGEWPSQELDHINRNRADNRISNLRLSNRSQQLHNTGLREDNTSGHKGVSWDNGWRAYITINGVRQSLGRHPTYQAAVAAREAAEANLKEELSL